MFSYSANKGDGSTRRDALRWVYTDHNSKFRLSENILGPSLKVTQSPILAILQYCCGLAQSQLPNMTLICFQRKRNFELRSVYAHERGAALLAVLPMIAIMLTLALSLWQSTHIDTLLLGGMADALESEEDNQGQFAQTLDALRAFGPEGAELTPEGVYTHFSSNVAQRIVLASKAKVERPKGQAEETLIASLNNAAFILPSWSNLIRNRNPITGCTWQHSLPTGWESRANAGVLSERTCHRAGLNLDADSFLLGNFSVDGALFISGPSQEELTLTVLGGMSLRDGIIVESVRAKRINIIGLGGMDLGGIDIQNGTPLDLVIYSGSGDIRLLGSVNNLESTGHRVAVRARAGFSIGAGFMSEEEAGRLEQKFTAQHLQRSAAAWPDIRVFGMREGDSS